MNALPMHFESTIELSQGNRNSTIHTRHSPATWAITRRLKVVGSFADLKLSKHIERKIRESTSSLFFDFHFSTAQSSFVAFVSMNAGIYSDIGQSDQQSSNNPVIARPVLG